jgi:hypothetical protein
VHRRAARHRRDQVDVAAEIDGGEVDQAADAPTVELGELALGDVEDGIAIPEMQFSCTPGERVTTCSCISVGPSWAVSTGPRAVSTVVMVVSLG